MLVILHPDIQPDSQEYQDTLKHLQQLQGVDIQEHIVEGEQRHIRRIVFE